MDEGLQYGEGCSPQMEHFHTMWKGCVAWLGAVGGQEGFLAAWRCARARVKLRGDCRGVALPTLAFMLCLFSCFSAFAWAVRSVSALSPPFPIKSTWSFKCLPDVFPQPSANWSPFLLNSHSHITPFSTYVLLSGNAAVYISASLAGNILGFL